MVSVSVLVIDSDVIIRKVLHACLLADGFSVIDVAKISEAQAIIETGKIDLITIEPATDVNGLDEARELRAQFGLPIFVISSNSDRNIRNVALTEFADDYMAKPFDVHEVVARCKALLRRTRGQPRQAQLFPKAVGSGLTLDIDGHQIIAANGTPVDLSATELKMLTAFVRNPNRVLSREHLLELCGGAKGSDSIDRAIDMRVRRLRRKLGDVGWNGSELISTVRGVGYIFRSSARHASQPNSDFFQQAARA